MTTESRSCSFIGRSRKAASRISRKTGKQNTWSRRIVQIANKRFVDLKAVDRELLEIRQRHVARTKIVEHDFNSAACKARIVSPTISEPQLI